MIEIQKPKSDSDFGNPKLDAYLRMQKFVLIDRQFFNRNRNNRGRLSVS